MTLPLFLIDDVDYGTLLKKLEGTALFLSGQSWEEMFDSVLKALESMGSELIEASKSIEKKRENNVELGKDSPTDLYWALSVLFVLRTIGMLYSKSTNSSRSSNNQLAHEQFLKRYISVLLEISKRKEDLLVLFPHHHAGPSKVG